MRDEEKKELRKTDKSNRGERKGFSSVSANCGEDEFVTKNAKSY